MGGSEEWDRWAKDYDNDLALWLSLNDDIIMDSFDFKNKYVIDIGAGTGRLAEKIAKTAKFVTILEPSFEMIGVARKKLEKFGNVVYVNTGFDEHSSGKEYDYVILAEVLHHLDDKNVRKLMGLLKKEGRLIIIEPIFVKPLQFLYKVMFKNFKEFGWVRGFKMLRPFFSLRLGKHLLCERYFTKEELCRMFEDYDIKRKEVVNDHFYFLEVGLHEKTDN